MINLFIISLFIMYMMSCKHFLATLSKDFGGVDLVSEDLSHLFKGLACALQSNRAELIMQDNCSPFVSGKKAKTQRKVTALRTTNNM